MMNAAIAATAGSTLIIMLKVCLGMLRIALISKVYGIADENIPTAKPMNMACVDSKALPWLTTPMGTTYAKGNALNRKIEDDIHCA